MRRWKPIDTGDAELLKEELGDVLLQVVFHAQLEREQGSFDFDDVCDGVVRKMILRHPHVFGDVTVNGTGDVLRNWDAIKKATKHQTSQTEVLRSVASSLPALMRAQKVRHKAAASEPLCSGGLRPGGTGSFGSPAEWEFERGSAGQTSVCGCRPCR